MATRVDLATIRRDLALLRIRANLAIDPFFDLIADLIAGVFRRRVGTDQRERLTLDTTSAGLIRSDIGVLLGTQRDEIAQVIGYAVTTAEAMADKQAVALVEGGFVRTLDRLSVVSRIRTLLSGAFDRVTAQIGRVLANAIQFGHTVADVATRIERYLRPRFAAYRNVLGKLVRENVPGRLIDYPGASGMGLHGTRLIAWREITDAHRDRMATIATAGGNGLKWLLSPMHVGADICDNYAASDQGYGPGIYLPGTMPEPPHVGCFPAGVVVRSSQVLAGMERWYSGQLVNIKTASGHLLPVTPNHPILTPNGWVAAGLLKEGDDVICRSLGQGEGSTVNPHNDDVPSPIEDVAKSFIGSASMVTRGVPTTTEDFHGDGIDGEVCVIRTNRELGDAVNGAFFEPLLNHQFVSRDMGLDALAGSSGTTQSIEAIGPSTLSVLSGFGILPSLLWGERLVHEFATFAAGSLLNSRQFKASADDCPRNPQRFRDLHYGLTGEVSGSDFFNGELIATEGVSGGLLSLEGSKGFPASQQSLFSQDLIKVPGIDVEASGNISPAITGQICTDRIVNVCKEPFTGHVYNLETSEGWYEANGIIAHNCCCTSMVVPLVASGRVAA